MFNPPIADLHGGYADVSALLTILADPEKHKARLDELLAKEKAIDDKTAAFNEMHADTRRLHTSAEATTIVLTNRQRALDARETELDERAKGIEKIEAKRSDAALQRREAECTARENAIAREEKRLAAIKADLEGKHAKVRDLAGALG